jgi:serine/tyrosine/threonine adenylyltransferase
MFAFDNTYAHLPPHFYAKVAPTPVRTPRVVKVNRALCEVLDVDPDRLGGEEGARILSGNEVPSGAEPIALAYAGHQFGSFVRQLGDGRAILLGEVVGKDGARRDVQLKGAGRTPFSRGGDGRAALGPVLREYVVSEAMFALGVPTTRALAAVTTGEPVFREEPLPGAILTRVAASHLRVGTFEFFAARDDREALGTLTTYALKRHYPDALNGKKPAIALLAKVIEAQANLVARWLGIGFVHGVMNTDNTSISGETIDYGPCAFLDAYDPRKRFSSIDRGGRYAFAEQPRIALWNLARLAEALLPLLDDDEEVAVREATDRLERFPEHFESAHARVLRAKLGLSREEPDDRVLAHDLLERMAASAVDFTVCFRRLCACAEDPAADEALASLFAEPGAFREWAERWRARMVSETVSPADRAAAMRRANPAFIPRNHRVEEALAAAHHEDFAPFEALSRALARPYDDQPELAHLAEPPAVPNEDYRTFCGT